MRRFLPLLPAILFAVLVLGPRTARAQHPNVERGFAPGQAFQIGDVDHVNLFNGSLVATLPLGPSYPVGGHLSYGLTLAYSSNVWDFRLGDAGEIPQPNRFSNAGLGWSVSLGRYLPWSDPDNDRQKDLYLGADGGEHWFYDTLHAGDTEDPGDGPQPNQQNIQNIQYTRDGSYLRAKKITGGWTVEFPNGDAHTFDSSGRLWQIADRFNNAVTVSYGTSLWTLTDTHGRIQRIYFQSLPYGGSSAKMVSRIELTAFGGVTAGYDFTYTPATIRRSCMPAGVIPNTTTVQLLNRVSLPDGSSYQMQDYVTDPATSAAGCKASGALGSITLPTLGRLEWTWQRYTFPSGSATHAPPWQQSAGVATRAVRLPTGALQGVWTYQTVLTPGTRTEQEKELVNTVIDPLGHRTVNYFSVYPDEDVLTGWSAHDYSLPFTRFADDGNGRFLSTRVYNAAGTLLRSTYVRYEADQRWVEPELQDKGNLNRREASRRTVYADDGGTFADVNLTNFDGLGHYRRSETGNNGTAGNFGSADLRIQWTFFNPGAGTYQLDANGNPSPGFTMIPSTGRWILGIYWDRWVSDGSVTEQDLNCFDGTTGFLTGRRILRTSGTTAVNDVLVLYEKDTAGNVSAESFYGGDSGGLSTTDPNVCEPVPARPHLAVRRPQNLEVRHGPLLLRQTGPRPLDRPARGGLRHGRSQDHLRIRRHGPPRLGDAGRRPWRLDRIRLQPGGLGRRSGRRADPPPGQRQQVRGHPLAEPDPVRCPRPCLARAAQAARRHLERARDPL